MNFYAINVAPLNGNETQNGAGSAAVAVVTAGNGTLADLGAGAAALALTVTGASSTVSLGTSAALISIVMAGADASVQQATSAAQIVLSGEGETKVAVQAEGDAVINLAMRFAIPRPLSVPIAYHSSPRVVHAQSDARTITVPADRQLLVRPDRRADYIQREGRGL